MLALGELGLFGVGCNQASRNCAEKHPIAKAQMFHVLNCRE